MEKPSNPFSIKKLAYTITASSVGTIIEWYDFYIFVGLATIISSRFFPKENPTAAFLATLATFSAGFVVRPFGALFFGRLGDLVGRKYTFMVTLVLMGGSTFLIGLVPEYKVIGFWSPLLVLVLRLLQGLAIGGEYGGAATFVAEHSPISRRGFWTSWIQSTTTLGFIISLSIILLTKSFLSVQDWENWGWRIPFLVSSFLVVISVYIRKNMEESPLFSKAKAEGKTSKNPLWESFGNKSSLKRVLLSLFGLTMGLGVVGYSASFYAQSFMLKTMLMNYDQATRIVVIGGLLSIPAFIFFGWLSDRIGRKYILMASLLVGTLFFKPIFGEMYQSTNLKNKVERVSDLEIKSETENISRSKPELNVTKTQIHHYTDGTLVEEIEKEDLSAQKKEKHEMTSSIKVNSWVEWKLIFMIFLLCFIHGMAYGPVAAYLVEMFPLKIRYSSLSLPYHIGFGIFGGMSLVISSYLIEKAKIIHNPLYYLEGLNYAMVLMMISFIIGVLYLKDYRESETQKPFYSKNLNLIKRFSGVVWILLGLGAGYFGIFILGIPKISSGKQDDLIFGIIMLFLITPITSLGLILFGKYALQGEYDDPLLAHP